MQRRPPKKKKKDQAKISSSDSAANIAAATAPDKTARASIALPDSAASPWIELIVRKLHRRPTRKLRPSTAATAETKCARGTRGKRLVASVISLRFAVRNTREVRRPLRAHIRCFVQRM